jgi:hypothetical protein
MVRKPIITMIQYKLYEMTEPYVAEFCHPRMALKIPHPPPPLSPGLPNYPTLERLKRGRWIAYIDVPDTLVDIVRTSPRSEFCSITSDGLVPGLCLEIPYSSGEETGCDEIEEASGDHQEELKSG